jgi:alkaline phosphatase D
MILDDHEIEDNWTQDRIAEDRQKRILFNLAIGAYMSYQWCHGPRSFGKRLYYSFDYAGFPFFVLDERTQRFKNDAPGLDDNHLLGRPSFDPIREPSQIDRLLRWLSDHKDDDRPKFIVTPTVFAPNPVVATISDRHKEKSDSWPAFPATRRLLLNHIIRNKIQNVVFLSGDIHCSNVARIFFSGSPEVKTLKAFSITSSAFYWPYSFADGEPSNYVHDSIKQDDAFVVDAQSGIKMNYQASNFTQEDNFCRIDVNWPKRRLEVRAIDRKGDDIVKSVLKLAG